MEPRAGPLEGQAPHIGGPAQKHEALLQDGNSSSMKLLGKGSSEINHEVRKCQKLTMQESYDNYMCSISISPPFLQKKTRPVAKVC